VYSKSVMGFDLADRPKGPPASHTDLQLLTPSPVPVRASGAPYLSQVARLLAMCSGCVVTTIRARETALSSGSLRSTGETFEWRSASNTLRSVIGYRLCT